jgi:hypothetical protein
VKILDQLLIARCFLECVEVFAMKVLNECPLKARDIVSDLYDRRDRLKSRASRGPASAFAGDQLEAVVDCSHQDRLNHPDTFDRVDE